MAISLLVCITLLGGWEVYARTYTGRGTGLRVIGPVVQDASSNDDLARSLRQLQPAPGPRIVLFGSSQIASVKDEESFSTHSIPFQMSSLERVAPRYQVLDLSGPAQQVFESMAILLSHRERLNPGVVVLGVGLFSMLNTDIRPTLREAVDGVALRRELATAAALPPEVSRTILTTATLPSDATAQDSTIQQRVDARLETGMSTHLAMIGNHRAMYNALVDQPLRRDLVQFLQRRGGPLRTARTYEFNNRYSVSLDAIAAMAAVLRADSIPFVVCILPSERTRTPPPYSAETIQRLAADLNGLASVHGFSVLDLSNVLRPEDFGVYADGSPDGLHFHARGHGVVGKALADFIAPMLAGAPVPAR